MSGIYEQKMDRNERARARRPLIRIGLSSTSLPLVHHMDDTAVLEVGCCNLFPMHLLCLCKYSVHIVRYVLLNVSWRQFCLQFSTTMYRECSGIEIRVSTAIFVSVTEVCQTTQCLRCHDHMVHSPKLQMSPHWPAVSAYTVTAQAHTPRLHMSPHMTTLWGCICRPTGLQFRGYTSPHMPRVWGYICHRTGPRSEVMHVTAQCLSQTLVISLHRATIWGWKCHVTEPRFEVTRVTTQGHGLR
jgi:hypothetical protein